jgi:hypothetical protein
MTVRYGGSRNDHREQSSAERLSDVLVCVAVGLFAILLVALVARGDPGSNAGPSIATTESAAQLMFMFEAPRAGRSSALFTSQRLVVPPVVRVLGFG